MFAVADSAGGEVTLDDLLAPGPPLLLIFASPQCDPCKTLLPEVARWQAEHAGRLTVAVASDGTPEDVRAEAEKLGLDHVLVDEGAGLHRSFEADGTPSAVLIAADGSIASRVAPGPDRIREIVSDVLDVPGVPIGAPVPPLELPSLEGELVSLADLRGRDTLLLFWDPDCGYCRAMHDDLLAWESTANGGTPKLVVVSSGEEERSRSDGFRSTVLLDEEFAAGEHFGVSGTPMGVLVGADGRIASGVAAGAAAVLALAAPD
jgi:thiol-disulfide isomerase/thioredoxin